MNKALSIAILVVGVILPIYGISAGQSFASEVKESVTGTPTDRTLWFIIGGVVAIIVGGFGLVRGRGDRT